MTARRVSFLSWVACVGATLASFVFLAMGVGDATPGDDFVIGGWGGERRRDSTAPRR